MYATFKGYRTRFAQEKLDQYGPIVVIAPDHVHTSDDEAMKIIYDRSAIKTRFYAGMGSWKGVKSTLGILDYHAAAPTRNNLMQCFQSQNLISLAEHVESHVNKFVSVIEKVAERGENVNGIFWYRLLALDIVTDVLWGERTELLESASKGETNPVFLRRFHAFSKYNALKSYFRGMDTYVRFFGTAYWKRQRLDCLDMDVTARAALDRWAKGQSKGHQRDVLTMLKELEAHEDPSKRIPNDHVLAYLVEMLAAGSSTTAITAALTTFQLIYHPDKQKKLRIELFEAFPDPSTIDMRVMTSLKYLDACIRETMRLHPMIPGPLERYIGHPIQVAGKVVPAGVVGSCSPYSQGRLPDVYDQPHEFLPERWLVANERMKHNWTPFGYGSRACPGQNLAMTELRYMIGTVFRIFKAVEPVGHSRDELKLADHFTAAPTTGAVLLKFEKCTDSID
jgi:cytochrome P450